MFFPISFRVLTAFLTLIQILLGFILSRLLVIYSKFGNKYANSIRWLQQGGYLSVLFAFIGSDTAPWFDRIMLFLVLSTMVLIALSGVILTNFTLATQQLGSPKLVKAISDQSVQLTTMFYLPSWTKTAFYGDNVTITLLSMINSPGNIPNMQNDSVYEVRQSDYHSLCDVATVLIQTDQPRPVFPPPTDSCMTLTLLLGTVTLVDNMALDSTFTRPDGTVSMTYYGSTVPLVFEFSSTVLLNYGNSSHLFIDQSNNQLLLPANGTSSPPTTIVTKNWSPEGYMAVLSMTTTRIYAGIDSLHDTLEHEFGSHEMFKNIETSIQQSTFTPNATFSVLFAELRLDGTMVEIASCMTGNAIQMAKITINCFHVYLKAIVATSPQQTDLLAWPIPTSVDTLATVKHIPKPGNSTHRLDTRAVTDEAADLFARLGKSVTMQWYLKKMVIYFDQYEILNGFEVPDGLVYALCPFLCIFLLIALWTFKFEDKYTSSFLDLVHSLFVFKIEKETRSRLVTTDIEHGVQLRNGHLAFEINSPVKDSEYESFNSSVALNRFPVSPKQTGPEAAYLIRPTNSPSPSRDIHLQTWGVG
ncbi:hypothetical protein BGZ83_000921 [Gryganskiella cystojenkinii]|nr:hypothetical protein BGZ83_000921 [Gryganskiella cystojenkinii]